MREFEGGESVKTLCYEGKAPHPHCYGMGCSWYCLCRLMLIDQGVIRYGDFMRFEDIIEPEEPYNNKGTGNQKKICENERGVK